MSRRLLTAGSMLMLVTVALWLADAVDWMPGPTADRWSGLTLKAALIALGAALLFRLMSPVVNSMSKGRCLTCGRGTERGHTYCLDHLQRTVNETRDEARSTARSSPRPHPQTQPRSRA